MEWVTIIQILTEVFYLMLMPLRKEWINFFSPSKINNSLVLVRPIVQKKENWIQKTCSPLKNDFVLQTVRGEGVGWIPIETNFCQQ